MRNSNLFFISCVIILLLLNILSAIFGKFHQFIIIGIFNFIITIKLLKINPFKYYGLVFIFFYFFLINGSLFYSFFKNDSGFNGYFTCFIYNLSSLFAVLVFRAKLKWLNIAIYSLLFLILSFNFHNMYNYYLDFKNKSEIVNTKLPEIKIFNLKGDEFALKANGRVQVIDLWSNSCGYCITAFPEFQKVFNKYKNDDDVEVFALNVDENIPNRDRGSSFVEKYSFRNYFVSKEILEKLKFNTFPNYMIVSKKGQIKYFGNLNTGATETYNNIYDLIENEK